MHAQSLTTNARSVVPRLLLLPALLAGLTLAFAGPASAQGGFNASAVSINPKPAPCPNGEFLCGTATTSYGDATWTFTVTSDTPPSGGALCGSVEATATFTLADGSTLNLDENDSVCGPGNSLFANGHSHSYGNPFYVTGTWTVQSATGEFSSITGSGTDALHLAGAATTGTYAATP